MSKTNRKRYTAEEKSKILKRHLLEGEALSSLCDEYNITATTFYNWQKKLFENAATVLESQRPGRSPLKKKEAQIKELEAKLSRKDEVIAEAVEAMMIAKKLSGENSTKGG